jgi:hypothetical protein
VTFLKSRVIQSQLAGLGKKVILVFSETIKSQDSIKSQRKWTGPEFGKGWTQVLLK